MRYTSSKTAAASSSRKKRRSSAAANHDDRSPSPQLEPLPGAPPAQQPAPPESFWGVEAQPAKRKGAPSTRLEAGAASKALRNLSEQRAMLVLGDDDDDEIAPASSSGASSGSDGAGPSKYEPVAAKSKREKEEALGASLALFS